MNERFEIIRSVPDSELERILKEATDGGSEYDSARTLVSMELQRRRDAQREAIARHALNHGTYDASLDLEDGILFKPHPEDDRWIIRGEN